jgi:monomeric isocitrate dehydrogenase
MVFDYFLLDAVEHDLVREGNNNLVKRCDEIWVFGSVSNGVLAEIQIANRQGRPVRYFAIEKPHKIVETTKDKIDMESDVANMRHLL